MTSNVLVRRKAQQKNLCLSFDALLLYACIVQNIGINPRIYIVEPSDTLHTDKITNLTLKYGNVMFLLLRSR
jgi:hypothetical protein